MVNFKNISIILLVLIIVPGFVYGYYLFDSEVPDGSGNYVFVYWSELPQDFVVDSGTLAGSDGFPIVQSACRVWDNVERTRDLCGNLSLSSEDITASTLVSRGVNYIVFDEDGTVLEALGLSPFTIGVAINIFGSTGEIRESLLVIRGTNLLNTDLLSTTVHELGHVWGLGHTAVGAINSAVLLPGINLDPIPPQNIPTMYPFNNPVNDEFGRTLELDDEAVIKLHYPE